MVTFDQSGSRLASRREESSRFLKKAAQKLLVMLGHRRWQRQRPMAQASPSLAPTAQANCDAMRSQVISL
jgi:hypothetical protein